VCREVKRQDFAPTNYTTRCSTLSTPGVITYSCLVSSRPSSPVAAPPRRAASQSLGPWLVQTFTSRRNTADAGVRELLNSSYLLLKSRTVRAWRGAGRNSIETRRERERLTDSDGRRRRMERERRPAAWDSAYSLLYSEDYLLPTGVAATRRYLYVITTRQPSEASGTVERRRYTTVRRDETWMRLHHPVSTSPFTNDRNLLRMSLMPLPLGDNAAPILLGDKEKCMDRLNAYEMKCFRRILNVSWYYSLLQRNTDRANRLKRTLWKCYREEDELVWTYMQSVRRAIGKASAVWYHERNKVARKIT